MFIQVTPALAWTSCGGWMLLLRPKHFRGRMDDLTQMWHATSSRLRRQLAALQVD